MRVDLEPSRSQSFTAPETSALELVPLGETRTDEHGAFDLQVGRLGDLTGYAEPDGTVSLLVSSLNDSVRVMQHLIVLPVLDGETSHFVWEVPDENIAASTARGRSSKPSKGDRVTLQLNSTEDVASADAGEITTMGVGGQNYCAGSYYWQRSDANVIKTWDRIMRAYTKTRVTGWRYEWQTGTNTQVDAAANIGTSGALVAAGYVSSASTSGGVNFVAGANYQMDARIEYDNRVWYLYCQDPGGTRYSGVYEWRPYAWTGGNSFGTLNTAIFNCPANSTSTITQQTWVTRSNTLQFSVGATLSTVNLRTSQTHSSQHALYMTPNGSASICGNTGYFTQGVPQVREV